MICIGCGSDIWTEKNENESGEWCVSNGQCEITDFEGVNRLRQAFLDSEKKREAHEGN